MLRNYIDKKAWQNLGLIRLCSTLKFADHHTPIYLVTPGTKTYGSSAPSNAAVKVCIHNRVTEYVSDSNVCETQFPISLHHTTAAQIGSLTSKIFLTQIYLAQFK